MVGLPLASPPNQPTGGILKNNKPIRLPRRFGVGFAKLLICNGDRSLTQF